MVKLTSHFNKKLHVVFLSICLLILATFTLSIGIVLLALLNIQNPIYLLLFISINFALSFIILPYVIANHLYKFRVFKLEKVLFYKIFSIISILLILVLILDLYLNVVYYFLVVSIAEEYLFREIIFKILQKEFPILYVYIIGSILFAFVLHINEPLLINLIIRFPSALFLNFLRSKFNLFTCITTHWIYNLIVVEFI
ncbi:type II CAAX prenyl endopeptidase Rce1 family protein [Mammaliicoccus sp. Dog046]|uniref:CPBP family glutamic-type intramembrane protease n=1 Tax=Mammaliicoccus sp. Dog046 TaxID=3034233 RepID=UPI003A5BEA27